MTTGVIILRNALTDAKVTVHLPADPTTVGDTLVALGALDYIIDWELSTVPAPVSVPT